MSNIDRQYYEERAAHSFADKDKLQSEDNKIGHDIDKVISKVSETIKGSTIQYAATWLLDKDEWLDFEVNGDKNYPTLGKGRVVNVNPGVDNIGREERYTHLYIVLAEYKETFVGVPITNAKLLNDGTPVLRNELEVFLINPTTKKKYKEFRCTKPSVADLRNIRCFDKSRIIKDGIYTAARIIPDTYKSAVREGIVNIFKFE